MYDVIILGSGPAGYTAAIYTSRAFFKTLIIGGPEPGGQLSTTTAVDNFPGFPDGIQGPELVESMKKQAVRFGTEIQLYQVSGIKYQENSKIFFVKAGEKTFEGKAIIIATGASAKRLGIASEEKFRGKGISYCATCDGFFFHGKNIAVLGGGDTAMEDATFLTRFATHVTIIHRRDQFRASAIMLEKAKKNPKISFLTNTVVEEFYGDTVLRGVKINGNKELPFDGVFVAIGHEPNTAFLKDFVELDEKGFVVVKSSKFNPDQIGVKVQNLNQIQTATNVPGVFAAGDCTDPHYRQAIVAAGMGCQAAIDTQKWLEEEG
jgi:thioredoxin reductase (NADPH)